MCICLQKIKENVSEMSTNLFCGTEFVRSIRPAGWVYPTSIFFHPINRYAYIDRCFGSTHDGPPYTHGGPFGAYHVKEGSAALSNSGIYIAQGNGMYKYEGGFACSPGLTALSGIENLIDAGYDSHAESHRFDASNYGPEAWRRYAPGRTHANLGQMIAEAKDIPRMLKSTASYFRNGWKSHRTRRAANEWLNTQFGWLPFISDVVDMYNMSQVHGRMYKHVVRYNNVWKKYGGSVRSEGSSDLVSEMAHTSHYPILNSYYRPDPQQTGSTRVECISTLSVWFEGKFRYYIPDLETVQWQQRFVRQLFGLSVTPALVWELTPWSWLADWYTNAGEVFANMDTGWADNLAASSAYVMASSERLYRCTSVLTMYTGDLHASWDSSFVTKTRGKANPFGFGLTMDDLSPRQMSILGALGISRFL